MKVLLAADIFPPETGGPATYVVALANALAAAGDDVTIVSLTSNSDIKAVHCSLFIARSKQKFVRYMQYLWLLFKHSKQVDVIYAMGPVNAGLPACIVAWFRRKKFVVKVVGDYAWEQFQNQKSKIKNHKLFVGVDEFQKMNVRGKIAWLRRVERGVVKRANKVIVPSEYLKGIVVGWGAKSEKVKVVYNAVEFKTVEPVRKPDGEQWIVSVGRLVPWKGMDTLINMMSVLLKKFPNLKLKIVGDGPCFANHTAKIIQQKLDHAVNLTGALPHEEALSYIAAADVFVLNSGYEGLPHVVLEALHAGVPVLASDVGGNPELVAAENLFAYNETEEIQRKIAEVLHGTGVDNNTDLERFNFSTMFVRTKNILEHI